MTTTELATMLQTQTEATMLASNFIDRMEIHDPYMELEKSLIEYAVKYRHTWIGFESGTPERASAERLLGMLWVAENF